MSRSLDVVSIQEWFGRVLQQPITLESSLVNTKEVGFVGDFIKDSPTLKAKDCLQIYAQQYWWRLFKVLHDQYPLVVRLFGYTSFNESIAKPFLLQNPPHQFNICFLGEGLTEWLQENYKETDRDLVISSASIDWKWNKAFVAADCLLPTKLSEILTLSKTTYLFELKWSLFKFRKLLLEQEPEYWIDNDFPELEKEHQYYFVLRRTPKNNIRVDELSEAEYRMMERFKSGQSIRDLCDELKAKELPQDLRTLLLKPGLLTPL